MGFSSAKSSAQSVVDLALGLGGPWGSRPHAAVTYISLALPWAGGCYAWAKRNPLWLLWLAKHTVLQQVCASSQVAGGAGINRSAHPVPTWPSYS